MGYQICKARMTLKIKHIFEDLWCDTEYCASLCCAGNHVIGVKCSCGLVIYHGGMVSSELNQINHILQSERLGKLRLKSEI